VCIGVHPWPKSSRRAFTFLEVLFSVIIIGIGFVMIAAIFPVAIQQSQANVAEAAAVATSRDALRYLQAAASAYTPPASIGTGLIVEPIFPATTAAAGNFPVYLPFQTSPQSITSNGLANGPLIGIQMPPSINLLPTADRRFSWTGFYRRDMLSVNSQPIPAPYAQVAIVTGQATADGQPLFSAGANGFPATSARPVTQSNFYEAQLFRSATPGFSTIQFRNYAYIAGSNYTNSTLLPPSGDGSGAVSFAPNAYILVLSSPNALNISDANVMTGWYARIGVASNAAANTYFLQNDPPQLATVAAANRAYGVFVFVLGRPLVPDPSNPGPPLGYHYAGPPQDITCVSGFIAINNCN